MKRLTSLALALSFSVAATAAHAAQPSPWFQTGQVHETDGIVREYIIPHSVQRIGRTGHVFAAYVRDTFDPPVNTGTSLVQSELSSVAIDCDNLAWGVYEDAAFAPSGEPVWMNSYDMNRSLTYWLPKDMKMPTAVSLSTLNYICNGK
jgi:hypothetical protein